MGLAGLVRDVAASLTPLLASKEISLAFDPGEEVEVWGERFLLRQSLSNLIQNAVEFSPLKGVVTVELGLTDGEAVLKVSDEGPGIPEYALAKVFDRFYSLGRPGTGKKSSGLGLTFTREAAVLHSGEVSLENLPGGGVRAVLRLPLIPPTPS